MKQMIDVVDEEDNVIGKATRDEVVEKKLNHRIACVFIFNSKGELFVQQRKFTKKIAPGEYEFVAGGVLDAGEGYEEGAKRELEEETGIKGVELKNLFDFKYRAPHLNYNSKYYYCIWDGEIKIQEEEAEKWLFVNFDKLEKLMKTETFAKDIVEIWDKYKDVIRNAVK